MEKQVIMPLLSNISSLHTTPMGINRIRKNLRLADIDVVEHCKNIILNENYHIYREGKLLLRNRRHTNHRQHQ